MSMWHMKCAMSIPRSMNVQWGDIIFKEASALDVLWGQPIKLIQVASTSELHENQ